MGDSREDKIQNVFKPLPAVVGIVYTCLYFFQNPNLNIHMMGDMTEQIRAENPKCFQTSSCWCWHCLYGFFLQNLNMNIHGGRLPRTEEKIFSNLFLLRSALFIDWILILSFPSLHNEHVDYLNQNLWMKEKPYMIFVAPHDKQFCNTWHNWLSCEAISSCGAMTNCSISAMWSNLSLLHMKIFTPHDEFTMYAAFLCFTLFWRKIHFVAIYALLCGAKMTNVCEKHCLRLFPCSAFNPVHIIWHIWTGTIFKSLILTESIVKSETKTTLLRFI